MEIIKGKLQGCFEIILQPRIDDRGFFMRTYDNLIFAEHNIDFNWVQENHSRSECRGTIRGMHFQFPPYAETKLIRCIRGEVLDVFIDLRLNSETFGQWDSIVLTESKKNMALVPRGFAHGFYTLTDVSEVVYKVDNYYSPQNESGINALDPQLALPWPAMNPILSEKDKNQMPLKTFIEKFQGIRLE